MLFPVVYRSKFPRCDKLRSLSVTSLFPSFLSFSSYPISGHLSSILYPLMQWSFLVPIIPAQSQMDVLFSVLPFARANSSFRLYLCWESFLLLSAQFHYPAPFAFPFCHFFAKLLSRDSPSFLRRRPTVPLFHLLDHFPFLYF